MDNGLLSGVGTLLIFIAFIGVSIWAFSSRQKKRFEEAAQLPFADEEPTPEKGAGRDHKAEAADSADRVREPSAADTDRHRSGE